MRTVGGAGAGVNVVRSRRVQVGAAGGEVVNQFIAQAAEAEPVLPTDLIATVVLVISLLLTVGWLVYLYR
jgi:hypothetical protein